MLLHDAAHLLAGLAAFLQHGGIADQAQAERMLGTALHRTSALGTAGAPDDVYEPVAATTPAARAGAGWEWSRQPGSPAVAELRLASLGDLFCVKAAAIRVQFADATVTPLLEAPGSFTVFQRAAAPAQQIDVSVDALTGCVAAVRLMQFADR